MGKPHRRSEIESRRRQFPFETQHPRNLRRLGSKRPTTQPRRFGTDIRHRSRSIEKRQRQRFEIESEFLTGNHNFGKGSSEFEMLGFQGALGDR